MNTKSFTIGFVAMDSMITAGSATKRGIIHAAKSTKTGVLDTSDAVASFFAGAKHAVKCRRGSSVAYAVREMPMSVLTHEVRSNEE